MAAGSDDDLVTVTCANPFHRGPAGGPVFETDPPDGVATAEVSREQARALLEEDPAGYRCPELEDEEDEQSSGEEAPASKRRGQAMARLTDIDGVGPSYARQLVRAGIETKGALKAAVTADLEERTGIGSARIEDWQASL